MMTMAEENVSLSFSIAVMSSCRYTMNTGLPSSPGIPEMSMRWMGSSRRIRASSV